MYSVYYMVIKSVVLQFKFDIDSKLNRSLINYICFYLLTHSELNNQKMHKF